MGFGSKFKELVGISDGEGDEDAELKAKESSIVPQGPVSPRPPVNERPINPTGTKTENRATLGGGRYTNQFKLVVIEPTGFDESPKLVDSLKAKKPVIINLENLETDVARKIFDFLSGATYALDGNVQKIANNIFVFTPENVDVSYNMNQKASELIKSPWNR